MKLLKIDRANGVEEPVTTILLESDDLCVLKQKGLDEASALLGGKSDEKVIWISGAVMGNKKLSEAKNWFLYIDRKIVFRIY
ncbi:hypothetical protein ACFSJ3_14180 [Corallincola platygyrae]|uniref:Uncharacterized protein n=1 Tax=Corallincola platygyrae TaxID=1193278 RepID=A0ABW4XQM0_9GAMM